MVSKVTQNSLNSRLLSVSLQSQMVAQLKQQLASTTQQLSEVQFTLSMIPVHRLSADLPVTYRSAIAFKLAPVLQLPSLDLANQIIAAFPISDEQQTSQVLDVSTTQLPSSLLSTQKSKQELSLNFEVEVVFPGWIDFRLTNCSLAIWLQKLTTIHSGKVQTAQQPLSCFSIQYAHARCCSLLNLAACQDLIILKDWQLIEPYPIPWLEDEIEAATGRPKLRLCHPAEKRLISQFLTILEATDNWNQQRKLKAALALSQAFAEFYQHCRIWGEVKTQTPKLAQARLGLVAVTQQLLRSLQDDLHIPAPMEL